MNNYFLIQEKYANNFAYFYSKIYNLCLVRCKLKEEVQYYKNNFLYGENILLFFEEELSFSNNNFNIICSSSNVNSEVRYFSIIEKYLNKEIEKNFSPKTDIQIQKFISSLRTVDENFHLTSVEFFLHDCAYDFSSTTNEERSKQFLINIYSEVGSDVFYKLFNMCIYSYRFREIYLEKLLKIDIHGKNLFEKFILSYYGKNFPKN